MIGQAAYESSGPLPFPSFVDVPYLAFYALLLAGLLSFPSRPADRCRRGCGSGWIWRSSR